MNRKEFCSLLTSIRQKSSLKMKEICSRMDTMPTTIYRTEKGTSNYPMGNIFSFVSALDYAIELANGNQTFVCTNNNDFVKWLKATRSDKISQVQLAERVGVAPTTIMNIENNHNIATIDTFLKIVASLDHTVSIQPQKQSS